MEVNGKTADGSAYLVSETLDGKVVEARVPEALLAAEYGGRSVSHQMAYEWLSTNRHDVVAAMKTLAAGGSPRPPYDQIALA